MKRVFITAVSEQMRLEAFNYQTTDLKLQSDIVTPYPIFNVMENEVQADDDVKMIIIKFPGEFFDKNLEILEEEIGKFEEKFQIKITRILINRDLEETIQSHNRLFQQLAVTIPNNHIIYADITYGTKPTPIAMFAALNYADLLKSNVSIEKIVYGKIEWGKETKKAYIYDVSGLFHMNSIVSTMSKIGGEDAEKAVKILLGLE